MPIRGVSHTEQLSTRRQLADGGLEGAGEDMGSGVEDEGEPENR